MNPIIDGKIFLTDHGNKRYVGFPIQEWVLRYSIIQLMCSGRTVLDVGSKYGQGVLFLSQWAKKVIACDIENQLETGVEFVLADFTNGSFPLDEKFDIVNCMEVVEHVENPEVVIKNCHKCVKNDGLLTLTTPSKDRHIDTHVKPFYEKDEIISLISSYFDIVFLEEHMGVSWFCVAKPKEIN